ncbi:MAG: thiamine phosphate synthase [Deltaproteobacteria bacterium]
MRVDFRVYLVTDRKQARDGDILAAVAAALDGGIRAVQLREKDLGGRELFRLAEAMRRLTARYGARFVVNDRVDVAYAVGADGVHLGGGSIPVADARALLGARALVGRSAHGVDELAAAERDGADFATFGPVYATPSKAAYGPPLGVPALAAACAAARIPVFALGGVGPGNMSETLRAGAFGIALISAVVAAADPRAAALELTARFAPGR